MFFVLASFSSAQELSTDLKLIVEEITPDPVEPGADVSVKLRIQNDGNKKADDVTFDLQIQYPFFLKTESQNFETAQSICSGCSKDNSYHFSIESDAVSGVYPLKYDLFEENGRIKTSGEVNIRVTGKPDIIFESTSETPRVKPGNTLVAELAFKNVGTGKARKIKVSSSSEEFIKLGSGVDFIEEMKAGETISLPLSFTIAEKTVPDTYRIPIVMGFSDEQGTEYESTEFYGVEVIHGAEVGLQSLKISPPHSLTKGDEVEIQLRVENTGSGNADNVKVRIDSPFDGNKVAYLGRLEKDDDRPTIFTLQATKRGEIPHSVHITYHDDVGNHETRENFTLTVGSGKWYFGVVVLILIITLIIFFIRNHQGSDHA